jgi:hypothetical protein
MVAMTMLCGTKVKYIRLLFHLVGGNLATGVKGRKKLKHSASVSK